MNAKQANYTDEKARKLQRTLYLCANTQPTRRFHALYDKIYRWDILREAWRRVKENRGSAGVDKITIKEIQEEIGESEFLRDIQEELLQGVFHPKPVKRVYIPKGDGKQRPLGIPTVKDRVVQMATKIVIEPIFEADFKTCSYGFRPKKNAHQAIFEIRKESKDKSYVLDVDIKGYFDHINQDKLMKLVEQRISDRRVLKLVRKWLKAGIMENDKVQVSESGTPQGGVISPLLANIYLNVLDTLWEKHFQHLGSLIRYADDFVILCKTKAKARLAVQSLQGIIHKLDLTINREKSGLVNLWNGKEGFDFLGLHHRKFPKWLKGGRVYYYLQHIPCHKAMNKMRDKIRRYLAPSSQTVKDIMEIIKGLNRKLKGFRNYYLLSAIAKRWLAKIDWYVIQRLTIYWNKKKNRKKRLHRKREIIRLTKGLLVKTASGKPKKEEHRKAV